MSLEGFSNPQDWDFGHCCSLGGLPGPVRAAQEGFSACPELWGPHSHSPQGPGAFPPPFFGSGCARGGKEEACTMLKKSSLPLGWKLRRAKERMMLHRWATESCLALSRAYWGTGEAKKNRGGASRDRKKTQNTSQGYTRPHGRAGKRRHGIPQDFFRLVYLFFLGES